jgi:hypothetical protein
MRSLAVRNSYHGVFKSEICFLIREVHIYRHLSTCKLQAADVVVHELQWNFIMVSAFERK